MADKSITEEASNVTTLQNTPLPKSIMPEPRAAHPNVQPVQIVDPTLKADMSYNRAWFARFLTEDGAAILKVTGEVDYDGDPGVQARFALHAFVAYSSAPRVDGKLPAELRGAIGVETERYRFFMHLVSAKS